VGDWEWGLGDGMRSVGDRGWLAWVWAVWWRVRGCTGVACIRWRGGHGVRDGPGSRCAELEFWLWGYA